MKVHTTGGLLFYFCPGCQHSHSVTVDGAGDPGRNWSWDGNTEAPTLSPSIRTFTPARTYDDGDGGTISKPERTLCHHFLKQGQLEFLGDSSGHDLRGFHALPDFPKGYGLPGLPNGAP